jgi:hypothetical protein
LPPGGHRPCHPAAGATSASRGIFDARSRSVTQKLARNFLASRRGNRRCYTPPAAHLKRPIFERTTCRAQGRARCRNKHRPGRLPGRRRPARDRCCLIRGPSCAGNPRAHVLAPPPPRREIHHPPALTPQVGAASAPPQWGRRFVQCRTRDQPRCPAVAIFGDARTLPLGIRRRQQRLVSSCEQDHKVTLLAPRRRAAMVWGPRAGLLPLLAVALLLAAQAAPADKRPPPPAKLAAASKPPPPAKQSGKKARWAGLGNIRSRRPRAAAASPRRPQEWHWAIAAAGTRRSGG